MKTTFIYKDGKVVEKNEWGVKLEDFTMHTLKPDSQEVVKIKVELTFDEFKKLAREKLMTMAGTKQ